MNLSMSCREMEDFLSGSHIARIASVKPDTSPHVTPVWYLWEDNRLLIAIPKGSVKERNITKNNKVAVTIDLDAMPNKGVIIEGEARIEEELSERTEKRIVSRYVDAADVDEYMEYAHANFQSVLLTIHPEKIISWDYSKDPFLLKLRPKV